MTFVTTQTMTLTVKLTPMIDPPQTPRPNQAAKGGAELPLRPDVSGRAIFDCRLGAESIRASRQRPPTLTASLRLGTRRRESALISSREKVRGLTSVATVQGFKVPKVSQNSRAR